MIVLSGASASGKTEAAKALARIHGITKIITTTTRPMRVNEVAGRDYFFVTVEEFKQMIKDDKFVEYTFYNNNYYGSTKDQIKDNRCLVIDPAGLKSYMSLHDPRIVTFFLEVDEETRYERMISRGDKVEDAKRRIENDRIIFSKEAAKGVDYLIDSKANSIEEVALLILKLYKEELEKRHQLEK